MDARVEERERREEWRMGNEWRWMDGEMERGTGTVSRYLYGQLVLLINSIVMR
jgi:hypothetical protein